VDCQYQNISKEEVGFTAYETGHPVDCVLFDRSGQAIPLTPKWIKIFNGKSSFYAEDFTMKPGEKRACNLALDDIFGERWEEGVELRVRVDSGMGAVTVPIRLVGPAVALGELFKIRGAGLFAFKGVLVGGCTLLLIWYFRRRREGWGAGNRS
jgi:hypothetical protein